MKKRDILVAEGEASFAEAIKARLEARDEFRVDVVSTGAAALRYVGEVQPAAILLTATLAGPSGTEVCRVIRSREKTAHLPVIMLGDLHGGPGVVRGLELGADDYLSKPFDPSELEARLKAVLRRSRARPVDEEVEHFTGARIDANFTDVSVTVDGCAVGLTKREFRLLRCLVRNLNQVVGRQTLLDEVWDEAPADDRIVDAAVWRLRTKLCGAGAQIETVVGFGYRFNEPPSTDTSRKRGQ